MTTFVDPRTCTEYAPHRFCVEASTLGLAPGQWPASLQTSLGNKQPLLRGRPITHGGEFGGYNYEQSCGCIDLNVFND